MASRSANRDRDPGPVPKSEPNIAINTAERCIMVRVVRQKQLHQFNYTLAKLGTWGRCLRAARAKVKELKATLPEPSSVVGMLTKRNTSGVVGVRLVFSARRRVGRDGVEKVYPDWRWIGFWPECPLAGGIGFSVNKYGEDEAFFSAYIARLHKSIDRDAIAQAVKELSILRRRALLNKRLQLVPGKRSGMKKPAQLHKDALSKAIFDSQIA